MIIPERHYLKWRRFKNYLMIGLAVACVAIALVPLVDILWMVTANGLPILSVNFLTSPLEPSCSLKLYPADCPNGLGGIGPAIEGTFIAVGIGSLIAIPAGVGIAIFLSEYGRGRLTRPLARAISFFADVMTGTPSIVVGLFVYTFLLDFDPNIGPAIFSVYAGSAALAVIMIPVVVRTAEESMKLVPHTLREASWALGVSHGKTTRSVVLPSSLGPLVTGSILAVARAGGETAPLLYTMGWSLFYLNCSGGISGVASTSCLGNQSSALGPLIYNYGTYINGTSWVEEAWGAALVLVIIMLALSLTARIFLARRELRLSGG